MGFDKGLVGQVVAQRFSRNANLVKRLDRKIAEILENSRLNDGSGQLRLNRDTFGIGFTGTLFDEMYYRCLYPDVDPDTSSHHYLEFGRFENRWPNPFFESDFYAINHSKVCKKAKLDEPIDSVHFLFCDQFTCPTPLLAIENGFDESCTKRGEYLAAISGISNADMIVNELFDTVYFQLQSTSIGAHEELGNHSFGSEVAKYAFLSANLELFSMNASCSALIDDRHVNHQLGGAQFPRSVLSWLLINGSLSNKVRGHEISMNDGYDLTKIYKNFESTITFRDAQKALEKIRSRTILDPENAESLKISVFMICLNDSEMVISSLATLLALKSEFALEILILDNNSEPSHHEVLEAMVPMATIVRTNSLVSFGEANNILADYCSGDLILFLNSDAYITSPELDKLANTVLQNADVVAASPILIYQDGRIQEAGGGWFSDGSVVQFAKGLNFIPEMKGNFENRYRSAACLLVRKDVFIRVGGFNFVFDPAYYEDTYLCAEISKFGNIETVVNAKCVHLEGKTNNSEKYRDTKARAIRINRTTFSSRIANLGLLPHALNTDIGLGFSRKALVVSPYGLMIGGGEQYLLNLARHLSKSYEVTLAFPTIPSTSRFKRVLNELGIPLFAANLDSIENAIYMKPDLLVSMGNSVYPYFPPVGLVSIYHCQFPFPETGNIEISRINWAKKYDALIVNSPFTATNIQIADKLGCWISKTRIISPPVNAAFDSYRGGFSRVGGKFRIVSVGRFFRGDHCKNQLSLIDAFSRLDSAKVKTELVLMGGVTNSEDSVGYFEDVVKSLMPNVILKPNCSRSDVINELLVSDLYWHGSGFNVSEMEPWKMEHFGISPVEACQLGVPPLVPVQGGVGENISRLGHEFVYASMDELIIKTQLMMAEERPNVTSEELVAFGKQFTVEVFENNLDNLLTDFYVN
jgi:GT2 family glycosyltransferase/glycosyltransferase involved in cell wall biosynthesis